MPRSHGGGLVETFAEQTPATDLGARYKQNGSGITLTHVLNGSSAEQAGLCPQDHIIALNGFACTDFDKQWAAFKAGEDIALHYFRHGVLRQTVLTVQNAAADTALLRIADTALLEQWLTPNDGTGH